MPESAKSGSGTVIEVVMDLRRITSGGKRVYTSPDGSAIRDIYVPPAASEKLGNPESITVTIQAAPETGGSR